MVVRARQREPKPAHPHHQLLTWLSLFAVLNLGVHAFVLPSVSSIAASRRRVRATASHLPAYRDSFSQGDRGGSRSGSSSSSNSQGDEDESPKKRKLAKAPHSSSSSSSSDPASILSKDSDAWDSSVLRTPPSSALKPHHRQVASAAAAGPSSFTYSSSPSRTSVPPVPPSADASSFASSSSANAGLGQRPFSPTTGWLDPLSLSPASLAAAIHGLVKEITTMPRGAGPGPAEAAAKAAYQRKAWERQRYMERELSALLAVAERNLPSLTPEAVSTVINALSKLHPR
ncbi:hypothetical protein VYU27_006960, partial [Nannochloropsis oceanica]